MAEDELPVLRSIRRKLVIRDCLGGGRAAFDLCPQLLSLEPAAIMAPVVILFMVQDFIARELESCS